MTRTLLTGGRSSADSDDDFQETFDNYIRSKDGESWLNALLRALDSKHTELKGAVSGQVASLSDATLQRLAAALREPLGFDRAKAEWLAEQLLEAGEQGVLVAPNVLLDAYSRAKVRHHLRKHFLEVALVLGVACGVARAGKLCVMGALRRVPRFGRAAAHVLDAALPDAVLGPLLAARVLL
ncbi:hypothetical protein WJX81_003386 [Elliptochloris bilobata]|uniref:Uncharacterized protein n=1 Tax=Elliptochloris bilobata TaxID=381761 RepID=A0AAW1QJ69_9CHLO